LFAWPSGQTLDHDVRWIDHPDAAVATGLACILGLGALAFAVRRRLPLATLGVVWCIVALLPESSLVPIRDAMVEHRMYLPMVGLAWTSAALLEAGSRLVATRTRTSGTWLPGAALTISIVLAGVTHARNRVWRDEVSLWTDATVRSPHKARPHNNLGIALERLGRVAEAEASFRRAIAVEPRYVYGRVNLSRLYGLSGRPADALAILEEAERIEPGNPAVLNNLGTAWWALGDTARAAAAYERALLADPGAPDPPANLARMRAGTPGSSP
jgi:protein O-mannosyl-transferase